MISKLFISYTLQENYNSSIDRSTISSAYNVVYFVNNDNYGHKCFACSSVLIIQKYKSLSEFLNEARKFIDEVMLRKSFKQKWLKSILCMLYGHSHCRNDLSVLLFSNRLNNQYLKYFVWYTLCSQYANNCIYKKNNLKSKTQVKGRRRYL